MKTLFVLSEFIMYLMLIRNWLNDTESAVLSYGTLVICALFAVYAFVRKKDRKNSLLLVASLLTLAADYFLVYVNDHHVIGVLLFCLVQMTYALQLNNGKTVILRVLLLAVIWSVLYISGNLSLLSVLAIFSFVNLLINCIDAVSGKKWIEAVGLVLFLLCDLNVGLSYLNVNPELTGLLLWVFYVPSQVLLRLAADF